MVSRKLNASLVFPGAQQTWRQTVRHKQLLRYLLIIHKVFRFLTEPRRESYLVLKTLCGCEIQPFKTAYEIIVLFLQARKKSKVLFRFQR